MTCCSFRTCAPDHHGHVHDSAVTSVSIVSEGTLDLDEVSSYLLLFDTKL